MLEGLVGLESQVYGEGEEEESVRMSRKVWGVGMEKGMRGRGEGLVRKKVKLAPSETPAMQLDILARGGAVGRSVEKCLSLQWG